MNIKLNNLLLLALGYTVILIFVRIADKRMKTHSSDRVLLLRALSVLLVGIVAYTAFENKERFLFQVSPSKTVDCCPKGFNGMPIEFHYEGDSTRFRDCTQNQKGQIFPIQTSNYKLLDDIYADETQDVVEEYCGACAV